MRWRPLEDLKLRHRIMLMFVILVTAILLVIVVNWALANAASDERLYGDIPPDVTLLRLDKEALVAAYKEQVQHLWFIWIKGQAKSATEITAGLKLARHAYSIAADQISKREDFIRQSHPGGTDGK